ncbi:alpha/beta hydrolase-fold protein [Horticoccus sp. 23ND18S-11]|uniref:alpha/beta hydrolase-fold protein n=1 Tax=Horticoccus sp. 23ND18S-11 TaxID=3391832 RepID=UPI0039C90578
MHLPTRARLIRLPATLALLSLLPGLAAQPAAPVAQRPAARPAPVPPVVSPELHSDGRVTFRLRAPKATVVTVSGQFQKGPAAMVKDDTGLWSVTVGPIPSDLYEYSFNVDGVSMIDPGNPAIKPMRNPRTSILEIRGEPPLLHDFQNVPHGRVSLHWYASQALGRRRPLQVYTPPGYEANATTRYPTQYLFHGSGDNEATWVAHGHAHWILDNLVAQGRAQPMIVVMLDGHAVAPGASTDRNANVVAFERDLLQDVMPFVAANYRTREDATSRGIVGLSMGGGQSLTIGLKHPDRFAWVGGMSSSVGGAAELLGDGTALNRQLKLLWFACGKDDFLLKANQDLAATMTARKIRHEYVETEGNHSWPVWRRYLADFAPRVFQATK